MLFKLVYVVLASLVLRGETSADKERSNARADAFLRVLQLNLELVANNPLVLPDDEIDVAKGPYLGNLNLRSCSLTNLERIKRSGNVAGSYQNTTIETIIDNARVTCSFETDIISLKVHRGTLDIYSQLKGLLKINYNFGEFRGKVESFVLSNASPPAIRLPHIDDYLQEFLREGIIKKFNTRILTHAQNFLKTKIMEIINPCI